MSSINKSLRKCSACQRCQPPVLYCAETVSHVRHNDNTIQNWMRVHKCLNSFKFAWINVVVLNIYVTELSGSCWGPVHDLQYNAGNPPDEKCECCSLQTCWRQSGIRWESTKQNSWASRLFRDTEERNAKGRRWKEETSIATCGLKTHLVT